MSERTFPMKPSLKNLLNTVASLAERDAFMDSRRMMIEEGHPALVDEWDEIMEKELATRKLHTKAVTPHAMFPDSPTRKRVERMQVK